MNASKKYTVIKIGHYQFLFEDSHAALNFYTQALQAIPVDNNWSKLPNGREGVKFIVTKDVTLELESCAPSQAELEFTRAELEEKVKEKADLDGDVELVKEEDTPHEISHDIPF